MTIRTLKLIAGAILVFIVMVGHFAASIGLFGNIWGLVAGILLLPVFPLEFIAFAIAISLPIMAVGFALYLAWLPFVLVYMGFQAIFNRTPSDGK